MPFVANSKNFKPPYEYKMKYSIFLVVVSVWILHTTPRKRMLDCNDFKEGKFEIINPKVNRKYIIDRKENFQTEEVYDLEQDTLVRTRYFKINWSSNCEYAIFTDTIKSKFDERDVYRNSIGGVKVKILSIDNNCATFSTTIEEHILYGEICKIE